MRCAAVELRVTAPAYRWRIRSMMAARPATVVGSEAALASTARDVFRDAALPRPMYARRLRPV
jgi:hypothetical protein